MMAGECAVCDRQQRMPYTCKYCNLHFCTNHRLPERHNCTGLAKTGNQKWFEAEKSSARARTEVVKSGGMKTTRPKSVDSSTIPAVGKTESSTSWKREARERSSGPDTAPDGALIYGEEEIDHVVTLEEDTAVSWRRLVIIGLLLTLGVLFIIFIL